ncbi:MAG: OFA family MFS transporter [Alkaliphilus sp.]|nr:OFA family MFS transporter [Alkaliphilus sp.]
MAKYVVSRWSIPFAGFLFALMGGISYAWGVFIIPLETSFGWSRAQAALPVSVYLLVFTTIGMTYGGAMQDTFGPRKVSATGGVLFLLGYLLASRIGAVPHLWWLLLTYGIIGGLGCGLAYSAAVPPARKWFPDKPGLPMTIAVAGFGLAAAVFAPYLSRLIATIGIENTFVVLGIVTSSVTFSGSWLIRNPEPDWSPPGWENVEQTAGNMFAPRMEATLGEALKQPLFYFMWLGFVTLIFGGLLAMVHVTPFGISIIGLEKPAAALAMVYFGLANGLGRPISGYISEKIGPIKLMLVTYLVTAATYFSLNTFATTATSLYAHVLILGFGFAVTLGLFPVLCTIAFGVKNLGAIYGALITAFGVSAFFGPMVGGWLFDATGSYTVPFAIAGALTLIGWSICFFVLKLKYKLP